MLLVVILNNLALRRVPDIINYIGWMFSIIVGSIHSVIGEAKGKRRGGLSFELSNECEEGRRGGGCAGV